MINMTKWRVSVQPRTATRLFEVLARNRQSAVGLFGREKRTRKIKPNVYNTSSTIPVLYQMVGDTKMERCAKSRRKHVLGYTKRERDNKRRERNTTPQKNEKEVVMRETHPPPPQNYSFT